MTTFFLKLTQPLLTTLTLASIVLLTSCAGYKLGNIPSAEMEGVKTIYVPVVKNDSYEPSLQVMTTNALIRQLETDGTYQSSRLDKADATLEVTITNVEKTPKRLQRDNVIATQEYSTQITATFILTNHNTGKKVVSSTASGSTDFFLFNDVQEGERQALPLAIDKLAYNIIKQVTDGW